MDTKFGRAVKSNSEQGASRGIDAQELKRELRNREVEVLRWLGIAWPPKGRLKHIHCPFPGHDDKNPSWRWDRQKQAWFCSQCSGGDIIRAVELVRSLSFPRPASVWKRTFWDRVEP